LPGIKADIEAYSSLLPQCVIRVWILPAGFNKIIGILSQRCGLRAAHIARNAGAPAAA
jgi:hypothetical protein